VSAVAGSLLGRAFSVADAWRSASSSNSLLVDASSNTVMKEGIGAANVRGLGGACMLVWWNRLCRPVLSMLLLRRRLELLEREGVRLLGDGDTSWILGRQNSTFFGEGGNA
jgi:hypothetical protein